MADRLMIAGTGSGCGKTTVTIAVLAALGSLGRRVAAFKCGPDYIDPMFHRRAVGVGSRNLDVFLMGEEGVLASLARNSAGHDIAVLEGVMGLYDGQAATSHASSNHVSRLTGTPVVLLVNAKGAALSVCATIQGFMGFEPNEIRAVLLNNINESSYAFYRQMIEERTGLPVVGFMPPMPDAHLESRHLGLVTADEVADIQEMIAALRDQALRTFDFDAICSIASQAGPVTAQAAALDGHDASPRGGGADRPRIYIAQDAAFQFYYEDNHDLLRSLGAELCFFSPLDDPGLPADADGLILWGGYPELYAAGLEANTSMRQSLLSAIAEGLPTYAECGGFMYLLSRLTDLEGETYQMVGALPGTTAMTGRLQDFGYHTIEALHDNMLMDAGEQATAHFFHHSVGDRQGDSFRASKPSGRGFDCIVATGKVFAGYQHLHFLGRPSLAERFVNACNDYRRSKDGFDNRPRSH
jgi:cobyrinic acid a,c-diamide synthase